MKFLKIGEKRFDIDKRTIVMGILNVTTNSFFDGGKYYSLQDAVEYAVLMEKIRS